MLGNLAPLRTLFGGRSTRFVHAIWSVLPSHEWISLDSRGKVVISDEPMVPCAKQDHNPPCTLLVHDLYSNKNACRQLAEKILETYFASGNRAQCLLVDIRGHGYSDGDDYSKPHSIDAAVGDIADLISTVCLGGAVGYPSSVVGFGTLGSAIALGYQKFTSSKFSRTNSSHSEISGANSVPKPQSTWLLYNLRSDHESSIRSDEEDIDVPKCDEVVARHLQASSQQFLSDISLQIEMRVAIDDVPDTQFCDVVLVDHAWTEPGAIPPDNLRPNRCTSLSHAAVIICSSP